MVSLHQYFHSFFLKIHFFKFWSNLHKTAKLKQWGIEVKALIEILFSKSYFQRPTARKLTISWHGVQYSVQEQLETSKRYKKKTAPEWAIELNSSRQEPVSLSKVRNRLQSACWTVMVWLYFGVRGWYIWFRLKESWKKKNIVRFCKDILNYLVYLQLKKKHLSNRQRYETLF